jgi:hypothetical protein
MRDDFVITIHERYAREQVGNDHITVLIDVEMARGIRAIYKVDVLAL